MPEPKGKDPKRNQLKQRLFPGLWIDQNDHPHVSLSEMCEAVDLPPTEENMQLAKQVALKIIVNLNSQVQIVERRTEED